jgi:hypothetical protein
VRYDSQYRRSTLITLVFAITISIIIANSIIIISDSHHKIVTALWTMSITAATASGLGIIAICRHGASGLHGKSYLFLTLGIVSWFTADLTLLYYYYAQDIEEQKFITITDGIWFTGYGFLSLHLFTVIKSLSRSSYNKVVNQKIVIIASIIIAIMFIIFNWFNLASSECIYAVNEKVDLMSVIVTGAYPVLDLTLIIPSCIILFRLHKNYEHSVPWFLSSLSLLINSIADDGYLIDFVKRNSQHLIFWDLFYVADFIIIAGALLWYNRYHITSSRRSKKLNLEP